MKIPEKNSLQKIRGNASRVKNIEDEPISIERPGGAFKK
jgi:hypothetical protein